MRVIVPLTDWKDRYDFAEWLVKIEPDEQNNIDKTFAADAFQVRSVSLQRFVQIVGKLTDEKMKQVEKALSVVFKISV